MKYFTQRLGFLWFVVALVSSSFTDHPHNNITISHLHRHPKTHKRLLAYPFIKQDKNQISAYRGYSMRQFYSALDSLSNGHKHKVNIIHIGDSHIQADFFSGHLREMLQTDSAFGNGGRGLVFPYKAVRTNSPDNLKITYTGSWEGCRNIYRNKKCDWGLSGITATTYSPQATLTIDPNSKASLPYAFTKVKIFYDTRDVTNFEVTLLNEEGIRAVKMEDGYVWFELKQPATSLSIGFEKTGAGQHHFTLQGITLENDQPGIQYHAAGVNGAEVTSVLRMPALETHISVLKPDLVIISLGTNDAFRSLDAKAFKRNYGELIQRIRRASPATSILLTTPADNLRGRKYPNPDNARAVKIIADLAEETGVAVWDLYEIMGGLKSINRWYASRLAGIDRIHFTPDGYTLQAELLYDALMNDYEIHKRQKGTGPFTANTSE